MGKKVGVVLAGCGWLDGAEIQEAVAVLWALDRRGVEVEIFAPNISQMHVVDHRKGEPDDGARNVLEESARIARGEIRELSDAKASDLDVLILPGGFGAAKNLCSFAVEGPEMSVLPELEALINGFADAQKPMGFICIAPVIAAKVLSPRYEQLTLSIGNDPGTAAAIESMGARHAETKPGEFHFDQRARVGSTPAYMLGPSIAPVFDGIDRLVGALLEC